MSLRSRIAFVIGLLVLAAIAVNTLLQTVATRRVVLAQVSVSGDSIAEAIARAAGFIEEVPHRLEAELASPVAQNSAPLVAREVQPGASVPPVETETGLLPRNAENLGLKRLVNDLVAGEVREV